MAGEMFKATREEWPSHYAIADAVGGEVKPFDVYQGPYVVVGGDVRIGNAPYAMAPSHLGIVRLWITDEGVYREDTDTLTPCFVYDDACIVEAAEIAIGLIPDERS